MKSEAASLLNQLYDKNDDSAALALWKHFLHAVKLKFNYDIQERKRLDLLTGNFLMTLQDTLGVLVKQLKSHQLINSEPLGITSNDIELVTKTKRFRISHKHIDFEVLDSENKDDAIKNTRMEIQMAMA